MFEKGEGMTRTPLRATAWACVLTVVILSLMPREDYPSTGMGGHLEHMVAYAGTALFVGLSYLPQKSVWELLGSLAGLAGMLELLQHFSPGRHPGIGDFAASSTGASIGILFAILAARHVLKFLTLTDA